MKKIAGVLFILLLFYGNVLGAEDVKKTSPAKDFEYDLNEEGTGVVIEKYLGKDVEVIIPEVIKTFPVVCIGKRAFRDADLVSVTIPDSVKVIGDYAFSFCLNLTTFNILTIRKINYDGSVFYRCPNLSDESKAKIKATGYEAF